MPLNSLNLAVFKRQVKERKDSLPGDILTGAAPPQEKNAHHQRKLSVSGLCVCEGQSVDL